MARRIKVSRGVAKLIEAGKIPASAIASSGNIKWTFEVLRNLQPTDIADLTKQDIQNIYKQNYSRINKQIPILQEMESEHYAVPSLKLLQKRKRIYKQQGDKKEAVGWETVLDKFKTIEEIRTTNELISNVSRIIRFVNEGTYTKQGTIEYNEKYVEKLKRDLNTILDEQLMNEAVTSGKNIFAQVSKEEKEKRKKIDKIDVSDVANLYEIFHKSNQQLASMGKDDSTRRLEFFKKLYLNDLLNGNDDSINSKVKRYTDLWKKSPDYEELYGVNNFDEDFYDM